MMAKGRLTVSLLILGALASAGCRKRSNKGGQTTAAANPQVGIIPGQQQGMQPLGVQPGTLPGSQQGMQPLGAQSGTLPGSQQGMQPLGAQSGTLPGSQQGVQPLGVQPAVDKTAKVEPGGKQQIVAAQQAVPEATGLNENGTPTYGTRSLNPGFTPDPIDISVVSGGSLDVRQLNLGSGCVGYVTARPDFNIQLTAQDTMLRLYVTSDTDTTLIVNDSQGAWHCNDDTSGTNPQVDLNNVQPGLINVWIGSYQSGVQAHGTLHITELSSNHP